MHKQSIENIAVLIELDKLEIEAWIYAFNSEKDNNIKREFKDKLYNCYFDFYTNSLTFFRVLDANKSIPFNREQYLKDIKGLVNLLNNFDNLFRI